MAYKILARHKDWVANATIAEAVNSDDGQIRRFTATICGWQNWEIFEGRADDSQVPVFVQNKVRRIRDLIESGDENIFNEPNQFHRP